MSNMSYCRFENTVSDFYDCVGALQKEKKGLAKKLSKSEREAYKEMVELASEFLGLHQKFGMEEALDEIEEEGS